MNENAKSVTLISGGARSGKSTFALRCLEHARTPCIIATGWAGDAEMAARIARHKAERAEKWRTIEEMCDLETAFRTAAQHASDGILLDCVTLWVTNLMYQRNVRSLEELTPFLHALERGIAAVDCPVCIVTNEVGCGIVPNDGDARLFRDLSGFAGQFLALKADRVFHMVCGIPLQIK